MEDEIKKIVYRIGTSHGGPSFVRSICPQIHPCGTLIVNTEKLFMIQHLGSEKGVTLLGILVSKITDLLSSLSIK